MKRANKVNVARKRRHKSKQWLVNIIASLLFLVVIVLGGAGMYAVGCVIPYAVVPRHQLTVAMWGRHPPCRVLRVGPMMMRCILPLSLVSA